VSVKKVLTDPVTVLKGVGDKMNETLASMELYTVEDILFHFPIRYDRTEVKQLHELIHDDTATIVGKILYEPTINYYGRKKSRMQFTLETEGAAVKATMFNRAFAKKHLKAGKTVTLTGKWDAHRLQITVQHYKLGEPSADMTIQAFYSVKGDVTNAKMRTFVKQAVKKYGDELEEILPERFLIEYKIPTRKQAVKQLHLPTDNQQLKHARRRLVYEELLLFQLKMQMLKFENRHEQAGVIQQINWDKTDQFIEQLPFTLTNAQQQALQEILRDMTTSVQMNRLLQGDVGSGKTAVAMISLYASITAGYQGAFMVPTEILAEQHYHAMKDIFNENGLEIALLTSSIKGKKRTNILEKIKNHELNLIIGTHSLIQEEVLFEKLGFVVIDEQHRFGVKQRKTLREKGVHPDILYMTATPIPRTLAITAFGDMDVSMIKEMPKGRKQIETYWVKENLLERVLIFIQKKVDAGQQAYIVSPLIEESEAFDYQNAVDLYHQLQNYYPETINVGLLHGRMLQEEKEEIMDAFSKNEIQVLVSTTVIEVGVNVPNATVMLIYDAERFGLSQLHQLRGRVGRGSEQSYCILLADPKGEIGKERMRIMQETSDGFLLSEEDLKLRGPGDFFGKKQSGLPNFKVADIIHDYRALEVARSDAERLVKDGTLFNDEEFAALKKIVVQEKQSGHFD